MRHFGKSDTWGACQQPGKAAPRATFASMRYEAGVRRYQEALGRTERMFVAIKVAQGNGQVEKDQ